MLTESRMPLKVAVEPGAWLLAEAGKWAEGSGAVLVLTEVLTAMAVWGFPLWVWSVGSFLTAVVPATLRLKKKLFAFATVFTAIYVPVPIGLFQSIHLKLPVLTIPLHGFAVLCLFCNLYFVAQGLVIAETGERASFLDCLRPFLLLWFAIMVVWFVQPRMNRRYAESQNAGAAMEATAIELGRIASDVAKVENTCRRWEACQ
jgi:hypothetical protein